MRMGYVHIFVAVAGWPPKKHLLLFLNIKLIDILCVATGGGADRGPALDASTF